MNVNLQINRLILDGIELSHRQRALLQTSFESELSRLIAANGIPQHLEGGVNIHKLPIDINLKSNMNSRQMGQEIAQSIYRDLKSSTQSLV